MSMAVSGTVSGHYGRDLVVSRVLPYEIAMMRETANAIANREFTTKVVQNALFESFAIHARALIEFFDCNRNKKPDDADLQHYTEPTYQPSIAGRITKDLKDKINKQIAHITESRTLDPNEKLNDKDVAYLRVEIDKEIAEFKLSLTSAYHGTWNAWKFPGI